MAVPPVFVPPYASERREFKGVVKEYFEEKKKDTIKGVGYALGWVSEFLKVLAEQAKVKGGDAATLSSRAVFAAKMSSDAGWVKNGLSALEVPHKMMELHLAAKRFYQNPRDISLARDLFLDKATSLTNSVADAIDFSSRYVPICSNTMRMVKCGNFVATGLGGINGGVKEVQKIAKGQDRESNGLSMIKIATSASYVGLAALGLASMAGLIAAAPWMFLACLTSGLSFTVLGFYYERLVATAANRHIDLVKQNANLVAERDFYRNLAPAAPLA